MKKSKITLVPTKQLAINEGQLDWLPRNPRSWTKTDIDRMIASIEKDPDFAEDRPVLAVPGDGGTFVVFAHNLLTKASKEKGVKRLPTVVYEPENEEDKETIRRRAILDNGSLGEWDPDILANEWEYTPEELQDLGIADWVTGADGSTPGDESAAESPDKYGTDFSLPDGKKSPFRQVSFQMPDELAASLLLAVKAAQYTPEFAAVCENIDDKNSNGYAIYVIAKSWVDEHLEGFTSADIKEPDEGIAELRQYLRDALKKSGKKAKDVDDLLGTNGMSGHYFGESQWMFPTYEAYMKMREILPLDRNYFECKKIEMRHNLLTCLQEYKKNGQS